MGLLAAMISGRLGSRGLLFDVAIEAFLRRPPASQGLVAFEVSPLDHPNGRVAAHPEYLGDLCRRNPLVRLLHRVLPSKVPMCVERMSYAPPMISALSADVKVKHRYLRQLPMRTSKGFNRRVHDAFSDLQERRCKLLTQEDLAAMVAKPDNGKAVSGTTVGRWLRYQDCKGSEPKTLALIGALARALEVRTEWLAFGVGRMRLISAEDADEVSERTHGEAQGEA